jgi:hypothetical protein
MRIRRSTCLKWLSVATALVIAGHTATARPLPGDNPGDKQPYPINQVLRKATDHCGHEAVLRRGYYNRESDKGFGFDKMYHKHNLKRTGVFAFIIGNPDCGTLQNDKTTRRYDAYAHRIECGFLTCEITDIRHVFLTVNYRHDVHARGQKGVITAFCEHEEPCANWVDQAINLPAIKGKGEHASWSYNRLSKARKYKPREVPALPAAAHVASR